MSRTWIMLMLVCQVWPPAVMADETEPALRTTLAGGRVTLTLTGQLRDRFEYSQGRDFTEDSSMEFISQRTRLGAEAQLDDRLETFIQFQDVRLWGEEESTLTDYSADGLDLHQGWARVRLAEAVYLKLGRMEMPYDNHRLLGSVPWAQQGRTFDAAALQYETEQVKIHLFYSKLGEEDAPAEPFASDRDLVGLWVNLAFCKLLNPSLYYLVDTDYDVDRVRHTTGAYISGELGGFNWSGEFFYQMGHQYGQDISAYLAALRPGYRFDLPGKPALTAWAEFISGDDDLLDDTDRRFDTLFATNHPRYGFMDLFTNLPMHTGGRGLMDIGLRAQVAPGGGLALMADYHLFRLMHEDDQGKSALGHEVDLTANYALLDFAKITMGYSLFLPQDAITNLRGGDKTEHWFYLMTDVTF